MATRVSPPQNKTYYINPAYLTFVENSGYGANLIQVSASSSCYISVYDPANGIGYSDADRNYQRWKVTAYNNKFPSNEKFYIYVRLERNGTSALVIYDTVLRGVHGGEIVERPDEQGNMVKVEGEYDPKHPYYYIHIGEASEVKSTGLREITYDTGYLTSDEAQNDKTEASEMWELDKYSTPWLIKAKQWLTNFTVKGFIKLIGGLKFSKGQEGDEKTVTDIKRSDDPDNEFLLNEDGTPQLDTEGSPIKNPAYVPVSDETLATSLYVEKRVEEIESEKFLRKDQDDRTEFNLGVGGNLSVDGGIILKEKPISSFIRFYDEERETSHDAAIYSALMTDQRIEEEMDNLNEKFLRKDKEDTAHKHITFEEGITVYQLARMMNLEVEELATIARAVVDCIGSANFRDGFTGEGYQIWKDLATGNWSMTLDRLTVRKMMVIYELVIQKIRSAGGMIVVSAGNGKVKEVVREGIEYKFTFEDTNTFTENDLMRCQTFTGNNLKHYWVEVTRVEGENVFARVADFEGVVPEVGDECVLMGNTRNVLRQNMILISAAEDGKPVLDCYNGINSKVDSFEGHLRTRVGCLDDIRDSRFPADMQPKGYGLYADNCFLTGVFVLSNGNDIMTQFAITEGLLRSEISSVRAEINAKDNYLSNASFASNLDGWEYSNNVRLFDTSGGLLHFNNNFYSIKENFAGVVLRDSKNVLRIKKSFIMQKNEDYNLHPSFDEYENEETGEKKLRPRMFYVSFKYMCVEDGHLKLYFKDETNDGSFEEYEPIQIPTSTNDGLIAPNVSFTVMEIAGKWNGTGDFYLEFDGDIFIYDLALSDNALADVEEKFTTRFEQTGKRIELEATRISRNENDIAQIKIDANSLTLRVSNVEGRASRLEVRADSVETRVEDAEGNIGRLEVRSDKIESNVSANAKGISTLEQTAESIKSSVGATNDRIDRLNGELGDTNQVVEDLDNALSDFESEMDDFMSDGVITIAEAIAIEKYLNSIGSLMKDIESTYDKIYSHSYLTNPEKSALYSAFNTLKSRYNSLVSTISSAIRDGQATEADKTKVTDAFSNFDDAVADYNDALQDARDCITGYFANRAVETAEQALYDALPDDYKTKEGTYASALVQMAVGLSAVAGRFDDDGKLIEGAGWVTTSYGNTLWAGKSLEDGNKIISYINQTATTTTIKASRINLDGAVTYQMLNGSLQDELDGKATSKELAAAQRELEADLVTLNSNVSSLQTEVGKKATTEALNNYVNSINDTLKTKADSDLANAVVNGYTLILNGLIRTSFIDADSLVVKKFEAKSGNYTYTLDSNGFVIKSSTRELATLHVNNSFGYFKMVDDSSYFTMNANSLMYSGSGGITSLSGGGLLLSNGAVVSGLAVETGTSLLGSTGFIVSGNNITLPSASSYKGRVIFVRSTSKSATITSSSTIYTGSENTTTDGSLGRIGSFIFVSNGSAWYAFNCYYSN